MTATTWYSTNCPTWCAGQHAAILAPDSDSPELLDAVESVCHAADLAAGAGLVVSMAYDETHPDIAHPAAGEPRAYVWLPDHHAAEGATAAQLREWAEVLTSAAAAAGRLTGDPL